MRFIIRALQQRGAASFAVGRSSAAAIAKNNKRFFFASSTDHTRLLEDAEVFVFKHDAGSVQQYVLAAAGSDEDMVISVPQLHLARLFVSPDNCLYGARVINQTLGPLDYVCRKLVDAALDDIQTSAGGGGDEKKAVTARSVLHGLSGWVLEGYDGSTPESLQHLTMEERVAIGVIAAGDYKNDEDETSQYEIGKDAWEKCAKEFIRLDYADEASLYEAKGAKLEAIQHRTDTSEYADMSGGAMALFTFPNIK